jgi:hypothetical protein
MTTRSIELAEIGDLARRAERDYYARGTPDLVAVGQQLLRWLDGTDRWLAREIERPAVRMRSR